MTSKAELELVAKTKQATQKIDRFGKEASSTMKAFGAVAGAALAVFASRKIIGTISDVTKAASIQEDAVNTLNSSLKLAGDFSNEASQDLQNFASGLQAVTKIGDETTLKMLGLAKSFGVSNDDAKRLVESAADLAEVTGMSLESAVRNLGKTYGGLTGELGEVIPALKDLTKEQLQAGEAIGFIEKRFGGAAEAATNTYSGAVSQLSNAFGDLKEKIGEIITTNPQIIKAIKAATKIVEEFTKQFNTDGIQSFVSDGLKEIVDFMPEALRSLKLFALAVDTLVEVTPFGKLIELIKGVTNVGDKGNGVIRTLTEAYVKLARGVLTVVDVMAKVPDTIGELIGIGDLSDAVGLDAAIAKLEAFDDALDKTGDDYSKAVDSIVTDSKILAAGFDPIIEAADKLKESLNGAGLGAGPRASESFDPIPDGGPLAPKAGQSGQFDILQSSLEAGLSDAPIKTAGEQFADGFKSGLKEAGIELAQSFGENVLKGKQGGQQFLGDAVKFGSTAIGGVLGGPGGAAVGEAIGGPLGSFVTSLAGKTKEESRQLAEDFAVGVSEGLKAFAENAPIFIEALAENSGEIITALVSAMPTVAVALTKGLINAVPVLVQELVDGINYQLGQLGPKFSDFGTNFSTAMDTGIQGTINAITNIPTALGEDLPKAATKFIDQLITEVSGSEFISAFSDTLKNAAKGFVNELVSLGYKVIDAITPGAFKTGDGNNSTGGFEEATGIDVPGVSFSTGGFIRGAGNKDTVPAMLTPGELVIDRTTGPRLNKFLDSAEAGGANNVLLARIMDLLERPMQVQTSITIGTSEIKDVILQLSRSNARLTA